MTKLVRMFLRALFDRLRVISDEKKVMSVFTRDIVFCVDQQYVPHVATALYSLLWHNHQEKLIITVLTTNITLTDQQQLKQIAHTFDTPLNVHFLDEQLFDELPLGYHF